MRNERIANRETYKEFLNRRSVVFRSLPAVLALVPTLFLIGLSEGREPDRIVPRNNIDVIHSYSPIVKRVAPAVVNVYVRRKVRQSQLSPFFNDPFFRRFFGDEFGIPRERVQSSLGSGVIVQSDGVIVTNFHVIKGASDGDIKVALADKREFTAQILLKDEQTDLAVLKIDESLAVDSGNSTFPFVDIEDSDNLEVGDLVLAIGNPFGVGQTVTSGIVSALARTRIGISDYQFFIQTDAAINPGNSGGALVDMRGRLVGVNTAIFSRSGGSHGIGFAIPSNMVRIVVQSALKGGTVQRPWLGAKLQSLTSDLAASLGLDRPAGALIAKVDKNGPVSEAGLEPGDVIVGIDGRKVYEPRGLIYRFATKPIGGSVTVQYLRSGRLGTTKISLIKAPEVPPRDVRLLNGPSPFSGAKIANLSPALANELSRDETKGVIVLEVGRDTPARALGLNKGDIILQINDRDIISTEQLQKITSRRERSWEFSVQRGDRILRSVIR
jgi:Do/DeqQ family serine protease